MEDNTQSAETAPAPRLAAALRYAARGWHVFPAVVEWNAFAGAKRSRFIPDWDAVSTTDPVMITAWFGPKGLYRDRHVCIDMGKSGLVVIDADGAAGVAEWEAFRAMRGDCPETYRVATPGGGQHWLYRARPGAEVRNSTSKLAPGVDVRGAGGLVYAPPSDDGRGPYRWLEGEPESTGDLPYVPLSVTAAGRPAREYARADSGGSGGAAPGPVMAGLGVAPRIFTYEQAQAFLAPKYAAFRGLRSGIDHGYNGALFEMAQLAGHFVPVFFSPESAMAWLMDACRVNGMWGWPGEDPEATVRRAWELYPADWRAALPPERVEVVGGEPEGSHSPRGEPGRAGLPGSELNRALTLPPAFWEARPELAHIRQAAHARLCSPDVALHAVLARLAAVHPHSERIDTGIGGGPMTLNYFAAVTGPPSAGKSSSVSLARGLLPGPPDGAGTGFSDGLPVGSGEGLAESYMGQVDAEPGEDGKKPRSKIKRQVRHNAFMYVDEGEAIVKLMERPGATIGETLRRAWSGATLGQQNASAESTRIVPEGSYALGLVIGFQPEVTWPILRDTAGTPQRFVWVWAAEADVPEDEPEDPGVLGWTPRRKEAPENPLAGLDAVMTGTWSGADWREPDSLALDPGIRARIRSSARLARMGAEVPALDSKRDETCVRIAALLALLAGRGEVGESDWELAGMVWVTSCAVRDHLVGLAHADAARAATAVRERVADHAAATESARIGVTEQKTALRRAAIWEKVRVQLAAGPVLQRVLRDGFSGRSDREDFAAAIEAAIERGEAAHEQRGRAIWVTLR